MILKKINHYINNYWVLIILTIVTVLLVIIDNISNGFVSFYFPVSIIIVLFVFASAFFFIIKQQQFTRLFRIHKMKYLGFIFYPSVILLFSVTILTNLQTLDANVSSYLKIVILILSIISLASGVLMIWSNSLRNEEKTYNPKISNLAVFISLTLIFVLLRFSFPFLFTGSYFDEYFHLLSAKYLIHNGNYPSFYNGEIYLRGQNVTLLVIFAMRLLGENLIAGKMVPAFFGLLSFLLLINIVRKIFKGQILFQALVLVVYIVNPLMMISDFYIRMYFMYEFYLLVIINCFLYLFEKNLKLWKKVLSFLIILWINGVNYVLSNDVGKQILPIATLFLLGILIVKEYGQVDFVRKIKNRIIDFLGKPIYLIPTMTVIVILGLILIRPALKIAGSFINGQADVTSGSSYGDYFFNENIVFTIFFVIGIFITLIDISKRKLGFIQAFVLLSAVLFMANLIISKDFQTLRGLGYFLPLYFTCTIYGLSRLDLGKFRFIVAMLILIFSFSIIPPNFFKGPYIPNELPYNRFSELYGFAENVCTNATIYNLQYFPFDSEFYGVKSDFTSYLRYDLLYNDTSYKFDPAFNKYFTVFASVPLYINERTLISDIQASGRNGNVCVIYDSNSISRFMQLGDLALLVQTFHIQSFGSLNVLYGIK